MGVKLGKLEFYAGPKGLGAPDDLEQVIVNFVDGARKSLDVAVQELESRPIADALIRARIERGVMVRIVLEADYLTVTRAISDPFKPGGTNEANRAIHDAILRSKIWVRTDYNPYLFHQKFVIRDKASVLTGSTNFTPTGTHANLNHVMIVHDKEFTKTYRREFDEICDGHFGKLNEGHDPAPEEVVVSGVMLKPCFAPDHGPEMEIMKQMAKAKHRVDFAIFTFSRSSGIDDQMFALMRAGMTVRGALDASQGGRKWAATDQLAKRGADLYLVEKGGGLNKLHHKLMVMDDQVTVIGSFNYTGQANKLNDENIVIVGDADAPTAAMRKAQSSIAKFARAEIDRIISEHGKPVPRR